MKIKVLEQDKARLQRLEEELSRVKTALEAESRVKQRLECEKQQIQNDLNQWKTSTPARRRPSGRSSRSERRA